MHIHTHTPNTQRKITLDRLVSMKISDTPSFFKRTPYFINPSLFWGKIYPPPPPLYNRCMCVFGGERAPTMSILPFFHDELHKLLEAIMSHLIEKTIFDSANSASKICHIDFHEKQNHQ